jgi:DNA repair protein RecO (recombination protein O)
MYKQTITPAIILKRINYSEADRIVTFITPIGKVDTLVKGARRSGSKLAGGIELFSISQITFLDTRTSLNRVIDSRLIKHYGNIIKDLKRMTFVYECLVKINNITPQKTDDDTYFQTTKALFELADNLKFSLVNLQLWWIIKVLFLNGTSIELDQDINGYKLQPKTLYNFQPSEPILSESSSGLISSDHIKVLRFYANADVEKLINLKLTEDIVRPLIRQLSVYI